MADRYAVIVESADSTTQQWFLDALGANWFLDMTTDVNNPPFGHRKLLYLPGPPWPSTQEVQSIARRAPGSVWYIIGEPNRRLRGADVVGPLHDIYTTIKAADPTAKITSPSVLNWDFTCIGCAPYTDPNHINPATSDGHWDGYLPGRFWVDDFRSAYRAAYGTEPPVDIWAIDLYPIDWQHLPNTNAQLITDQLTAMRQYLNSIPEQSGKPIWITELSFHWGYTSFTISSDGKFCPSGSYQETQVLAWMKTVYDWLEANASSMKIEKWFQFKSYADIGPSCKEDPYAGVTLFYIPNIGSNLTAEGQYFKSRVLAARDLPW